MDALVVKTLNNKLASQPEFVYDETGRITGYKTKGGADTVFPFSTGACVIFFMAGQTGKTIDSIEPMFADGFTVSGNHIICKRPGIYKLDAVAGQNNSHYSNTYNISYFINGVEQKLYNKESGTAKTRTVDNIGLKSGDDLYITADKITSDITLSFMLALHFVR